MTQETRRSLRFPLFSGAVLIVAGLFTAFAWSRNAVVLGSSLVAPLATLTVAILASEFLAVVVPDGPTVSLSYPLSVAAIVYFGPALAALVSAISMLPSLVVGPRRKPLLFAFNLGLLVLCTSVAGLLFLRLGGVPLAVQHAALGGHLLGAILPMVAAATVGVLANAAILAIGFSIRQGRPMGSMFLEMASDWMLPSQAMLGLVGVAIAQVLAAVGPWGLALFIAPLLVARQTYQQSVRLREAYADTISSLVAALEAKDAYTKGHSVRVAEYAVKIATSMQFPPKRVARVEYAALLHDLGKVGVSRRVLAKETRLSDDEYAEIKRHPDIGAHIVADVPYLADLVPFIEHHHERIDGRGYGQGMVGEEIPLEARILAVADSYDAMTSVRPYRSAMSHEDAIEELRANRGTQFDSDVVDAFERACEVLAVEGVSSSGEPVSRFEEAVADEA